MSDIYGPRTCFGRGAELEVQVLGLYLEKGCWRTVVEHVVPRLAILSFQLMLT